MQGIVLGIAILLCRFFPHRRSLVQGGFAVVPLLGAALLQVCPFEKRWSLAGALWLCECYRRDYGLTKSASCNHPLIVINLAMISSNIKGHTRKSIFSSMYYAGYAVGNIAGPREPRLSSLYCR